MATIEQPPPEFVGLREAARRLGRHYMTAREYVLAGVLPASRSGNRPRSPWRVRVDDVERLGGLLSDYDKFCSQLRAQRKRLQPIAIWLADKGER